MMLQPRTQVRTGLKFHVLMFGLTPMYLQSSMIDEYFIANITAVPTSMIFQRFWLGKSFFAYATFVWVQFLARMDAKKKTMLMLVPGRYFDDKLLPHTYVFHPMLCQKITSMECFWVEVIKWNLQHESAEKSIDIYLIHNLHICTDINADNRLPIYHHVFACESCNRFFFLEYFHFWFYINVRQCETHFSTCFVLNLRWQMLHEFSLSLVCVIWCRFNVLARLNTLEHISHVNLIIGSDLLCVSMSLLILVIISLI